MTQRGGTVRWLLGTIAVAAIVAAIMLCAKDRSPPHSPPVGASTVAAEPVEPVAAPPTAVPDAPRVAASDGVAADGKAHDTIRVTVVDSDGSAIEGAFVGLSTECRENPDDWSRLLQLGRSDARGELGVQVKPDLPRFAAAWKVGVGHSRFVVLRGKQELRIVIERMDRQVEGDVVEPDGAPVVGDVAVELHQVSKRLRSGSTGIWLSDPQRKVHVDGKGHFVIPASSMWGECSLAAMDASRASRILSFDVTDASPPALRVTMPGVCGIVGLVLDAKGAPVEGSVVLVSPCLPPGRTDSCSYHGVSGRDGSYRVALYDAGEYKVTALGTAQLPWSRTSKLAVGAAEHVWVPVNLREAGDITGTIVPANGATLVKAVGLDDSGSSRESAVAADGSFTLRGLMHGETYNLLAFAGDDLVGEGRSVAGAAERVVLQAKRRAAAGEGR